MSHPARAEGLGKCIHKRVEFELIIVSLCVSVHVLVSVGMYFCIYPRSYICISQCVCMGLYVYAWFAFMAYQPL